MIKLDATYSDYVNTSDPKYPAGKAVDASGEEGTDGTPLLAKWMNDINGTRQAIIKEAFGDMSGVSGIPDDAENSDVLKALKKITQEYTNNKVADEAQARVQGDTDTLAYVKNYVDPKTAATCYKYRGIKIPSRGWYRIAEFQPGGSEQRGFIHIFVYTGAGDVCPENIEIFASVSWGGKNYKGGIIAVCPYSVKNIVELRIVSSASGDRKYLEAFFSSKMNCSIQSESHFYSSKILIDGENFPEVTNNLNVVPGGYLKIRDGVCSSYNDSWNNMLSLFRFGCYIQWPGMLAPDSVLNFDGYRWKEVNFNGCFFRAKGVGALPFNGGEQIDTIRNLKGDFSVFAEYWSSESAADGKLFKSSPGNFEGATLPMAYYNSVYNFDASRVVPVSNENRPRNQTIVIWQLEKLN